MRGEIRLPRLTHSTATNMSRPPSSAGIGSRLMMPRLMLSRATSSRKGNTPARATSPVTLGYPDRTGDAGIRTSHGPLLEAVLDHKEHIPRPPDRARDGFDNRRALLTMRTLAVPIITPTAPWVMVSPTVSSAL